MKVDIGTILEYKPSNVVENDHPWGCDIDDTLLLWDVPVGTENTNSVEFIEPNCGQSIHVVINDNNIRLLKEKKARGCYIVLWSQGGFKYCRAVRDALKLYDHVDLVMTKPVGLIDDLPPSAWLPNPVNIPYTKNYKKPKPTSKDVKENK